MPDVDARPVAICLMGPTAAGKTALAVDLVRRLPVEIISVDSALVYRGLDIGTAKPGRDVLDRAPHRLIDILDPSEAYSAARFRSDALAAMKEIERAQRVPLLVGGTMLYYRALELGLSPLPAADKAVRARLDADAARVGLGTLYRRLEHLDPVAAFRIHPNDSQRIQRALEVHELTGRTLSELRARSTRSTLPHRLVKLVLSPADRSELHGRIEKRFAEMLRAGFVAEVEGLRTRPDLDLELPSMRAVGYRQVWKYLDGHYDWEEMRRRGVAASRQLARRQLTWLRSEIGGTWLDPGAREITDRALQALRGAGLPV